MTQRELEKYLWGVATALRGTIDAGDYKQYIFPLLSSSYQLNFNFFFLFCKKWGNFGIPPL